MHEIKNGDKCKETEIGLIKNAISQQAADIAILKNLIIKQATKNDIEELEAKIGKINDELKQMKGLSSLTDRKHEVFLQNISVRFKISIINSYNYDSGTK